MQRKPFFLGERERRLFALATYPPSDAIGGLLYLHPFAEEMNKCRRMAALAARSFAEHGWLVLQVDLSGCGDSAGDFGDADWTTWLDDVDLAWEWLSARCESVAAIWTLRAGSLLASDWVARKRATPPLLFWQPVSSGEQHLTQFLRLKAAHEMISAAENKGVVAGLRNDIKAGRRIEVAGYRLAPELASGLQQARLVLPERYGAPVWLFEVGQPGRHAPSPSMAALDQRIKESSVEVSSRVVPGTGFWQTQEIDTAPELIPATVEALTHLVA